MKICKLTKIGWIVVSESDGLVDSLQILQEVPAETPRESSPILKSAIEQVCSYLNGELKTFRLPLKISGSDFEKSVWSKMMEIPYGETLSYGELALLINRPRAFRSVGSACGKNKIPIIIPCHRVIAANNAIGGFSCGVEIKKILLNLERGS